MRQLLSSIHHEMKCVSVAAMILKPVVQSMMQWLRNVTMNGIWLHNVYKRNDST